MAKDLRAPAPLRPKRGTGSAKAKRRAARLAAVQALYQIELAEARTDAVIAEFQRGRLGAEEGEEGEAFVPADPELFPAIVRGAMARRADVDQMLTGALDRPGQLERMELLLRSILRAGAYELLAHLDVHPKIVINEYLDVSHAFFAGREPGVVNGVLDRIARVLRAEEMAAGPGDGDQG